MTTAIFDLRRDLTLHVREPWGVNESTPDVAEHFRAKLKHATDIPALVRGLQEMPDRDWVWIDFLAGPVVTQQKATAGADGLWRDYLRPWTRWLR